MRDERQQVALVLPGWSDPFGPTRSVRPALILPAWFYPIGSATLPAVSQFSLGLADGLVDEVQALEHDLILHDDRRAHA